MLADFLRDGLAHHLHDSVIEVLVKHSLAYLVFIVVCFSRIFNPLRAVFFLRLARLRCALPYLAAPHSAENVSGMVRPAQYT